MPSPIQKKALHTSAKFAAHIALICTTLLFSSCDHKVSNAKENQTTSWQNQVLENIDVQWYEDRLVEQVEGRFKAVQADGFVHGSIARNWQPIADKPGTLLHHVRSIYTLVRGYNHFKKKKYLDASILAADFLLQHYQDGPGHWVTSIWPDGTVENKRHFDLAYVHLIDSLTLLYIETKEQRFLDAALSTWRQLPIWDNFAKVKQQSNGLNIRRLNSYMHLFEATLSLAKIDPQSVAHMRATYMIEFAANNLSGVCKEGRCYPEYYTKTWKPEATEDAYIDIGHNLQWARMVNEATTIEVSTSVRKSMERLLDNSIKTGYDYENGGLYYSAKLLGEHDDKKIWWGQLELLNSLIYFAVHHNREDLWPLYQQSYQFITDSFWDKKNGGFSSSPDNQPQYSEQPGAGYHFTILALTAITLYESAEKEVSK